ncbi:D-3-phosphoglycerate dehydrogenase [Paucilactobacillus oligofermentans DSM 15707 = LMG 22743]|uniref:D-3-phosphoglycerate dehydrogenase n=1 Tax=Paucilactobacillus oligofermentans DSM 15707 = LMG 22743 TaxID=1423778 RepID=A0A0R1RFT4_9LACO|nr:NAD(P)-dependent oxidoreductase [Paucilactobacillus oligofermentans]KRL55612.1 D-3-phosphoglycerate dehydrogenase [Paucilactobacillus oligofermentans DSM 15707 = LMG 22743]CUS25399.1 D-3-phosphoglycerate dehydrogenase SerA [Paucilactobacillus oligofermentans DSM 15707 = LMG 22743]
MYNDSYQMRQGNWDYRKTHQGIDLKNKTVGILGFGRIGQMVAAMLQVFGVNILIFDPHASDVEFGELVSRETIFEKSDIITIHLPLVDGTRGSISTHEFESMKSTAMIVNLARGPIVDTDALVTALRTNEIAAAGLDVFDEEPLAMNSPLFELENVLVTPHIASNTVETKNRMAVDAASEIDRVLQGKKPQWAVNQF